MTGTVGRGGRGAALRCAALRRVPGACEPEIPTPQGRNCERGTAQRSAAQCSAVQHCRGAVDEEGGQRRGQRSGGEEREEEHTRTRARSSGITDDDGRTNRGASQGQGERGDAAQRHAEEGREGKGRAGQGRAVQHTSMRNVSRGACAVTVGRSPRQGTLHHRPGCGLHAAQLVSPFACHWLACTAHSVTRAISPTPTRLDPLSSMDPPSAGDAVSLLRPHTPTATLTATPVLAGRTDTHIDADLDDPDDTEKGVRHGWDATARCDGGDGDGRSSFFLVVAVAATGGGWSRRCCR